MRGLAVVVVVLVGSVWAVACGGSSGSGTKSGTASPGASGSPTAIVVTGTPGVVSSPTPLAPADRTAVAIGQNATLDPYTDPKGKFAISLPHAWKIDVSAYGVTATLLSTDSKYPATALIGLLCLPKATVDELVMQDRAVQRSTGEGDFTLDQAVPVTVDGVAAQEVRWQGAYQGVAHDHLYIYFEDKGCAWRLVLGTFPSVSLDAMRPLFDQVVKSFHAL